MQQENEQATEFQDHDTRTWASFGQLASRWEQTSGLNRSEMLSVLLQGFLCGEIWPTILPNLYGGVGAHGEKFTASPARPHWMKGTRRFPIETFTRLDFLRAARKHLDVDKRDSPFAAGYRGLIGIPVDGYDPTFIETYIEKLTPSPDAVMRWCSGHGWPVPPGLACSETDVSTTDQEEHANKSMKKTEAAEKIRLEDARPDQQRKKAAKPRGRGGRKPGSGSYKAKDCVLWKKMKAALAGGNAKSVWEAAGQFAEDAPGTSVVENRRTRLAKGYRGWISLQ